jgi:hypothetical protein
MGTDPGESLTGKIRSNSIAPQKQEVGRFGLTNAYILRDCGTPLAFELRRDEKANLYRI